VSLVGVATNSRPSFIQLSKPVPIPVELIGQSAPRDRSWRESHAPGLEAAGGAGGHVLSRILKPASAVNVKKELKPKRAASPFREFRLAGLPAKNRLAGGAGFLPRSAS
jgi:hypothetical protein